jgi:glycosyltransferase involved in cell wall biosynthesis
MSEPRTPTIGLAIPYHGPEYLLRAAVLSVLDQHDEDWELLVLVDGPDLPPVERWLAGLADPRIRWHRHPRNLGVAGNFQACLEDSRASHVTFLGSDDTLGANYVSVVRRALQEYPTAAVVQPSVEVVDRDGVVTRPLADRVKSRLRPRARSIMALRGENLLRSLLVGNWAYFPALCWNRELILGLGFRQDLPVTLDLALLTQVILARGEFVVAPETAFGYRRHDASVSSRSARNVDRFEEEARLFQEIAAACSQAGWHRAARAARVHATSRLHAASLIPSALCRRHLRSSFSLVRHAFGT